MPTYYKRNTSGTTNWNLATSWSTVSSTSAVNLGTFPSSTTLDPVIFDANSSNVTVNVVSNCTSLDFTNYAGIITMTSNLTVHGNITLGVSMGMLGSGILTIGATSIYTSNGVTWTGTLQLGSGPSINITLASLITTVQNLRVSAGASGTIQTVNSNTLNILGDLTMLTHLAGSTQLNLIGTGTWNSQGGTNSEVRTKLNINTLGTITRGVNGSAYAGLELKYTQGSLVNGSANLLLSGGASTLSVISNGVNWGNVTLSANTTTLTDDMNINSLIFSNNAVVNGSNLNINENISQSTGAVITGTTVFKVIGTGNQTWNATNTTTRIANNMNIDKASGTVTITSANLSYGSATSILTYTQGTFVPGTSTFLTPTGGVTFNIIGSGFSLNNWNPVIGTYTINTNPLVVNNSLLLAGNTTFAGTAGWITNNFTYPVTPAACTLQAGNTYRVNGLFTMIGTAASRATLQSSDAQNVTVSIPALSDQMTLVTGTIPAPAAGYVLGSRAFTTALPAVLSNLLPDRPTILSGPIGSVYTLTEPIDATNVPSSLLLQVGKKAFFIVTNNGTSSLNVAYAQTRDIDSSGGITILAGQSFADNTATPNLFRTLNWEPLIAPSGSVYYTFVN